MEAFITMMAVKYTWFTGVVLAMGVLRMVFKPVMVLIHGVVASTASTADDEALERFEATGLYKKVCWLVDFLTSIKLPGWK